MTELWRLSASELATRIRSGDVSAKEAAQSALARLESVNPVLNAIVAYRPDAVIQRAEAVDRARARGDKLGPLAGVPVTVKINIDQRGFATTNGARSHENLIAQVNSPLVDNLEKAGAMLLGRSNSPTFALRWFTSNQRTTRDRHRYRRFDSVPRIRLRYPWNSPKPGTRAALREAARKLVDAGWTVDEIDDTPPIREAAQVQERLWLGDGFDRWSPQRGSRWPTCRSMSSRIPSSDVRARCGSGGRSSIDMRF
jgi:Asp-tRNA(Asn)/Glu-tRNA(Gln) amidotransferase A subunit family amidase